jgi:hypothetical protein
VVSVAGEIGDGHVAVVKASEESVDRGVMKGDIRRRFARCRRREAGVQQAGNDKRKQAGKS